MGAGNRPLYSLVLMRPESVCRGPSCSFGGTEEIYFLLDLDTSVYQLSWLLFPMTVIIS